MQVRRASSGKFSQKKGLCPSLPLPPAFRLEDTCWLELAQLSQVRRQQLHVEAGKLRWNEPGF